MLMFYPTCWRCGLDQGLRTVGGCIRCGFKLPTPQEFWAMQERKKQEYLLSDEPDSNCVLNAKRGGGPKRWWPSFAWFRRVADLLSGVYERNQKKMAKEIDDLNAAVTELKAGVELLKEKADSSISPGEVEAVTARVKELTASITAPPAE